MTSGARQFEKARADFHAGYERVKQYWPEARLASYPLPILDQNENLAVERIEADARVMQEKMLILTLGEHGIEGYLGTALLGLFLNEYIPRLDVNTTGLIIVQAINPWGMKHMRRSNQNNVDLNRNFVWDENLLDPESNPEYDRLSLLVNPRGMLRNKTRWQARFWLNLARCMVTLGGDGVKRAYTMGQHRFTKGLYYGGTSIQDETRLMMEAFHFAFSTYRQVLLLDIHSGYGPRDQMSVVNSTHEPRSNAELQELFDYPLIVRTNPAEFFKIDGDMVDFFYEMGQKEAPQKHFYGASFEFGTFGDSTWAGIRNIRAQTLENQTYWFGASTRRLDDWVDLEFSELFFPADPAWRKKAAADGRQAFEGILRAEGFIR